MAYSPFRAFRRHQKVTFAALTILCMGVFVLGGASGYFREMMTLFGRDRNSGNEVATLYGRPVQAQEIRRLQQQREAANLFMTYASFEAVYRSGQDARDAFEKSSIPENDKAAIRAELQRLANPQFGQNQLGTVYYGLMSRAQKFDSEKKAPEAGVLKALAQSLLAPETLQRRLMQSGGAYFGGGQTPEDILDFMLWKREADRLGIMLDSRDVDTIFRQETGNKVGRQQILGIEERISKFTPDIFKIALTDEFRVRLAKEAILGLADERFVQSADVTPYALWQFYEKERTGRNISMLTIPVDQKTFLEKVKEPTKAELKEFFEKHKDKLYDPRSPEAGFKQPERYDVEWVRADPQSKHFQTELRNYVLGSLAFSINNPWPAANIYHQFVKEYDNWKSLYAVESWIAPFTPLHYSTSRRALTDPRNAASAVAQIMGAAGTQAPAVVSGLSVLNAAARKNEMIGHTKAAANVFLAGATHSPLTATTGTAIAGVPTSRYVSMAELMPVVQEQFNKQFTEDRASKAIARLETKLQTLNRETVLSRLQASYQPILLLSALGTAGTPGMGFVPRAVFESVQQARAARDLTPLAGGFLASSNPFSSAAIVIAQEQKFSDVARVEVNNAIQEFGLEYGRSANPENKYALGGDPGLVPLRKAFEQDAGGFHTDTTNAKQFAEQLSGAIGFDSAFYPHRLFGSQYLYWKTGTYTDYVPTYAEVADAVKTRWKFGQAQTLAREAAEQLQSQIAKQAHNGEDAERMLRDASLQPWAGKLFALDNVSKLTYAPAAVQSRMQSTYSEYSVDRSKVEYSTKDLVDGLLKLDKEGQSAVFNDEPKAHFYVGAVVGTIPRSESEFLAEVRDPANLLSWYSRDTQEEKRNEKSVIAQLRVAAGLKKNEENWKTLEQAGSGRLGN